MSQNSNYEDFIEDSDKEFLEEEEEEEEEKEEEKEEYQSPSEDSDREEQSQQDNPPETPTRKARSTIWSHYSTDSSKASCKHCKTIYSIRDEKKGHKIGTSNLWRHMERNHHDLLENSVAKRSLISLVEPPKPTVENIEKALLCWIVSTNQPFNCVEDPSFRALTTLLSQGKHPIIKSGTTIKKRLEAEYNSKYQEIREVMGSLKSKVSFTLDGWTSPNNYGLTSITAHYITPDWKLKNNLLALREIELSIGFNIGKLFAEVLDEFNIDPSKIIGVTLDNASNNDTFIESCNGLFRVNHFETRRVRCFAHILNLSCKEILEKLIPKQKVQNPKSDTEITDNSSVGRLRALVKFIRSSPKRNSKFIKLQPKNNRYSILLDCPTRWNSTFEMIERAIALKPFLLQYIQACKNDADYKREISNKDLSVLHPSHWTNLTNVMEILQMYQLCTQTISGDTYVTISQVIPLFKFLFNELDRLIADGSSCTIDRSIIKNASMKLKQYFDKSSFNSAFATILDPRYNIAFISNVPNIEINSVRNEFINTLISYDEPKFSQSPKMVATMMDRFKQVTKSMRIDDQESPQQEAERYFKVQETETDMFDLLNWWSERTKTFPRLSKMARDFLSIQATSVASERTFSIGRHTLPYNRGSLKKESIELLLCLKSWMSS